MEIRFYIGHLNKILLENISQHKTAARLAVHAAHFKRIFRTGPTGTRCGFRCKIVLPSENRK